jgi:hypothetical protein
MALNLYRRHGSNCPGGRALHETTYESNELRRNWKRCSCPIYGSGTLGGHFKRKNTEQNTWPEARAVAAGWETVGRWSGDVGIPPPPALAAHQPARSPNPEGVTLELAVKAFLAEYLESSASNTYKKYSIIMSKLKAYSAGKGYVMINQWGPIDVREFRHSWNVSPVTAAKNMSIVKTFFEFALCNEWVNRNPARLVKNHRVRAGDNPRTRERSPFSDDELKLATISTAGARSSGPERLTIKRLIQVTWRIIDINRKARISPISSRSPSIRVFAYRMCAPSKSIACCLTVSVISGRRRTDGRCIPGSLNGCRTGSVAAPKNTAL